MWGIPPFVLSYSYHERKYFNYAKTNNIIEIIFDKVALKQVSNLCKIKDKLWPGKGV